MANSTEIKLIAQAHARNFQQQQFDNFKASYEAWNKDQEGLQQFNNDYQVWLDSQKPVEEQPTPQPTVQKSQPVQQIPSIKDKAPTPDLSTWFSPKSASGRDINKEAALKIANDAQKRKEANTYSDLDSALEALAQQKGISMEEAKRIYDMGSGKAQITSRGDSVYNKKAAEDMLNQERMQKYLDPTKKLTEQEKRQAREVARNVLDSYELRSGGVPVLDNDKDRQLYADASNLMNKTSKVANFLQSFLDPYIGDAKTARDTIVSGTDKALEGIASVSDNLGITDDAKEKVLADIAQRRTLRNSIDESNKKAVQNATTQNPWIATGGKLAGNISQYMLTSPIFDGAAAALGASSRAGKFLVNQLGQNAQDIALDTLPTLKEYLADGSISDEEKQNLLSGMGWNAVGNLIPGLIGEGVTSYKNAKAAKEAVEGVDDAVEVATKQAEEAAQNIDDIAKQMPEQSTTTIKKSMNKAPNKYPEGKMYIDDSNDINDILLSGNRDNKKRLKAFNEGKKVSIANRDELKEFLFGDNSNYFDTVTFGKVSDRLADEINNTSKGKFDDLYGAYLDIEKGHSGHSINNHSIPKDTGDMPLKEEDLLAALENTNNAKVLDTKKYNSGDRTVTLALPTTDGHVIMIETVSKSRGSLLYRNGWVVDNQKFIDNFLRSNPNSAEGVNPTAVRDGIAPYKENITDAIENVNKKSVNNFNVPDESFNQIDSYFTELARPMNEVQRSGIMDTVTDKKALEEWQKLNEAYGDYLNKSISNADINDVEAAKKVFDNTRKRYARAMKNINPEIAEQFNSGSYGYKIGRPLNVRNNLLKTEENAKETVDLINQLENFGNEVPKEADNVAKDVKVMAEDAGLTKGVQDASDNLIASENLNERGQSIHMRGKGKMQMEDVAEEVAADFEKDPDMYRVLRNADTKAKAEKIYNESANPESAFRDLLSKKDPAALPLGHQIAKDYSAAGNYEAAAEIYRAMGEELTKAGQFSQAAAINMMKNDPLTALQYAKRQIDNLNRQGANRFGDKWKKFSLTDEEKSLFDNIKPGDEEAIKLAYDQIGARLGKEYPTTLIDKLLEGRKIAMLFNVRTNVRNVLANVPTLGMRWMADRVEALGQNAAHLINPDVKVTQSLTGSGAQGRKLAKEVFESNKVQAMLKGDVGKYEIPELKNSLVQNKTMYKGTHFEKWLDKVTGDGIQKLNIKLFGKQGVQSGLETIRNATYKMLDLGDSPFVKENFVERLGSYIHAQGINNIEDIPDEAIEMAWEEAMKATYKDNSWAVQMLSGIKGGLEKIPGVGRPISQAAIPFLQAPGNIAARMVDYSPVKATKGIADIISGAGKNDAKMISKGIEEAAKGLTGTGLVLLGMALRKAGILTGTFSKDKDQKAFEKQNGFQEYALHAGDKYFSYDWAQPFAEPLIVGTLLADAIEKSDEYDSDVLKYIDAKAGTNFNESFASKVIGVTKEGTKASINSWFNASPLQGLQELMSGGYNGTDIAQNLIDTGVGDFAGAFVPASVNAVAKSTDNTQRNTYDPSNRFNTFVNQQMAKIPGLSEKLPAKYDTWGNELKNADTKAMAWASRFLIPGNYSYDRGDKVDNEINRLYEATQEAGVFPQVALNSVGDKKLNNREVSEYQKDMGQRSRTAVESFVNSDAYKSMADLEKVEVLKKIYGTSNALTKRDKFDTPLPENSPYKKAVAAYDEAGGGEKGAQAIAEYYTNKTIADKSGLDSDSKAYAAIQKDLKNGNDNTAQQKIDAAKQITDSGIDINGYKVYEARKNSIPKLDDWITEYKNIDSLGNSDGFVNQDEFKAAITKNGWSENQAVQYSKIYGNWKQIPYLKDDGTWGFHKAK